MSKLLSASLSLSLSLAHRHKHFLSASRSICAIALRFSLLALTVLAALTHPIAALAALALSDRATLTAIALSARARLDRASLAQHLHHLFMAI
jgi:hypothetical protein